MDTDEPAPPPTPAPYYPMIAVFYQHSNDSGEQMIKYLLEEGYCPLVYAGASIPPINYIHSLKGFMVKAGCTDFLPTSEYKSNELLVLLWWAQPIDASHTKEVLEFFYGLFFEKIKIKISKPLEELCYCNPVPIIHSSNTEPIPSGPIVLDTGDLTNALDTGDLTNKVE